MTTSWELRAATALAWLGVVPGALLCSLGLRVLDEDPGFLFVVLPFVAMGLLLAGATVASAFLAAAVGLHTRGPHARWRTALLGGTGVLAGLCVLSVSPLAGTLLALHGALLAWLMTTPAVARDLGPWIRRPIAPWGSTPGRGPWAPLPDPGVPAAARPAWQPDAPQQGPWSPPPTDLPWLSWKGHSGPRPPWWRVWEEGLARGIPLWELLVLVPSLLLVPVGLYGVLAPDGHGWVVALVPAFAGVVLVESRMRRRLAGR